MDGSALLKEVLKNVNVKGLIVGVLLNQVVKPLLADLVTKSENKLDDAALAFLLPQAEKSLVELIDKLLGEVGK